MIIFPAIDIKDGKVVRLYKGDYNAVKEYNMSCEEAAAAFKAQGATHIHAVDLDGAKLGRAVNADAVCRIIKTSQLFVEIGGGIRNEKQIQDYLEAGAARVILGTVAVKDYGFTIDMIKKYGNKIAVGVDAVNGKVAVSGWCEVTDFDALEFCERLHAAGAENIIFTDISRDGTLGGTNIEAYKRLQIIKGLKVTASGGISSIDEIQSLKSLGVYAAILGKALYENKLSLNRAIAVAEGI